MLTRTCRNHSIFYVQVYARESLKILFFMGEGRDTIMRERLHASIYTGRLSDCLTGWNIGKTTTLKTYEP